MDITEARFSVESASSEVAEADGLRIPSEGAVLAIWSDLPGQLVVRLQVSVVDGHRVLTSLMMVSDGSIEVTGTLLREVPVSRLKDEATKTLATHVLARDLTTRGVFDLPPGDERRAQLSQEPVDRYVAGRESLERRRRVTTENLEETARIYQVDRSGAPTMAVAEHLHMSHRTATWWVALARKRGLLPPYDPSKGN